MKRTIIIFLILITGFTITHAQKEGIEKGKQELINTDLEFSKMSEEKGMQAAFLAYWDENGVWLRPNSYPVVGKNKIKELYKNKSDKGFTLTWKPSAADIAESCDLGFTYGIWEMKYVNKEGKTETEHGTYATVWRKDSSGKWKMALDRGNDGLEPK